MKSSLLTRPKPRSLPKSGSLLAFRADADGKPCGGSYISKAYDCSIKGKGPAVLDDDKKIEDKMVEGAKAQLAKWGVKNPTKQQIENAKLILGNPSYRRNRRDAKDMDEKKKRNKRSAKIAKVMREFKTGELKSSSGDVVENRRQALAIALSEASRAA